MMDQPDAATLLRAMADTLTNEVIPATSAGPQHAARVVANLCRILEREWLAGGEGEEETRVALAALLETDGHEPDDSLADLLSILSDRLRSSEESFDRQAREILLTDVRRRLAINRPGYDA